MHEDTRKTADASDNSAEPPPTEKLIFGFPRSQVIQAISTLARLVLAGVWLYAGGTKVTDLDGSIRSVNAYELFPFSVAQVIGAALPMVEILLGVLLLAGLLTRPLALVSAVFLVAFIGGIISAWARGLRIDCGCFGSGGPLAEGQSPAYLQDMLRDIGFLAVASILVIWPHTWFSLDRLLLGTEKEKTSNE